MFYDLPLDTPIQKIRWPEAGDNHIYIRRDDLLPYSFGGNKVRIAAAFMQDMKKKGCDALIMYGDRRSNLCRVLANMCSDESVPCLMIATEEHADGTTPFNAKILEQFPVRVLPCPKNAIAETVDRAFSILRAEGMTPYYIYGDRTGSGNEGTAAQAYADAYRLIADWESVHKIRFDRFVVPYGTGSTQGGFLAGMIEAGDFRPLTGISISSRTEQRALRILEDTVTDGLRIRGFFQANEEKGTASASGLPLPHPLNQEERRERKEHRQDPVSDLPICESGRIHLETGYNCGGYGLYNEEIEQTIEQMLKLNSIPMDPTYTGKAFAGMIRYLADHNIRGENILFLHTGGLPLFFDHLAGKTKESPAEAYIQTQTFFPQEDFFP